jgi:hypothetical protein
MVMKGRFFKMALITENAPFTIHPKDKAHALACALEKEDREDGGDNCTFKVRELKDGSAIVEVYDENGAFLACL